jgi:hypothetical protein
MALVSALGRIKAETGATIAMRHDTAHLGYSLAVISGSPVSIQAAEMLLNKELGLGDAGSTQAGPGGLHTREVEVPKKHIHRIIGQGGLVHSNLWLGAGNCPVGIKDSLHGDRRLPGMDIVVVGPACMEHIVPAAQLIKNRLEELAVQDAEMKQEPCRRFMSTGYCFLARECPFSHGEVLQPFSARRSFP